MSPLEALIACAGSWRGTSKLQDPHAGIAEASPSTATVTPVLGGRFIRLDYTWGYQGTPQEGSILLGFEAGSETKAGKVSAHWIDSWHMGDKGMACEGPRPDGPALSVRGSYAAPPGPDWGWRIDVAPGEGELKLTMWNVWPESEGGREELAVEAAYARAEG